MLLASTDKMRHQAIAGVCLKQTEKNARLNVVIRL